MKDESGNRGRISHILEAIENIEFFIEGVSLESFLENKEKRFAVERCLEIIGEASNHISEKILYHPEISTPW